jgi:hypothetical protein
LVRLFGPAQAMRKRKRRGDRERMKSVFMGFDLSFFEDAGDAICNFAKSLLSCFEGGVGCECRVWNYRIAFL